jgi:hypothetical protein
MDGNIKTNPTTAERVRRAGLWLLFATVLIIPRVLRLRRHPRRWNGLRVGASLLGVAMIVLAHLERAGLLLTVCGTALVLFALVIVPERRKPSVDERVRELGALVVVSGGQCRAADGALTEARLLVGRDRLWALDAELRTLLELPLAALGVLRAEGTGESWKLCVGGEAGVAEFLYHGPFAEHLARVAESTLRGQLRSELPVLP